MSWFIDLPHDQAGGDGGPRKQTQMVVIHATDNTASDEAEAHYAEDRPDQTSAHFYSDEDSVIQALDTDNIAYGCFPIGNSRSVQFEITGMSNRLSDASLRRVAPVVARVCDLYGLPVRHVNSTDLRNGLKGIAGHIDVTYAWGEGDHTDPGVNFPWDTFIGYVQAALPRNDEQDTEMPQCVVIDLPEKPGESKTYTVPPSNFGLAGWGPSWASIGIDPKYSSGVAVRLAFGDGHGGWDVPDKERVVVDAKKPLWLHNVNKEGRVVSMERLAYDANDQGGHATLCIEYGKRA